MKKQITFKHILKQLKADLIGKDSYRGVTLTYSWLANQFGHISLGFIPTFIVYLCLRKYTTIQNPSCHAALFVSVAWLLFETYNFLGPLITKKHTTSKAVFVPSEKSYVFRPKWGNVAFDTLTDLLFFWKGALFAGILLHFSHAKAYLLVGLVLLMLYPIGYWFVTKMFLQYARLPIQFRLSQWHGEISEKDQSVILQFSNPKERYLGKHLMIFGGRGSGKSPLSVGIGTELSIKRFSCSYYTAMKLYNLLSLTDKEITEAENCEAWSWRKATTLLIDDINPGRPILENFISPEQFKKLIETAVVGDPSIDNRKELVSKNVIWVMGSDDSDANHPDVWKQMLLDIGVEEKNIYQVHVSPY